MLSMLTRQIREQMANFLLIRAVVVLPLMIPEVHLIERIVLYLIIEILLVAGVVSPITIQCLRHLLVKRVRKMLAQVCLLQTIWVYLILLLSVTETLRVAGIVVPAVIPSLWLKWLMA